MIYIRININLPKTFLRIKMKVLFNHQIFCYQKLGGIYKYFKELIKELSKNNTVFNSIG